MKQQRYDVVVIGAGSGGLTAAIGAAKIGKRTLLIEREHMGGECTNTGCIPSKALLHFAKKVAHEGGAGSATSRAAFAYAREKIQEVRAAETPEILAKNGVDVVLGEAVFETACSVRVGETTYTYKRAVIATGSSPRPLEVPGLTAANTLTNQNLFDLEEAPARTLIIGSGAIGLEMGQALALLGSQVTIASIDAQLGTREDEALRPYLHTAFAKHNITFLPHAHISRVENNEAVFEIKNEAGDVTGEEQVSFDKVLVAIGRVPNFPDGLEAAGIKHDTRSILIDSQYRTANKYVYAVGDVAQQLKFTHTADHAARGVITHIASRGLLRASRRAPVPKVTYTAPEIAQVGLSHEEALSTYGAQRIRRIEVPLSNVDRATTDEQSGVLVVIVKRLSGTVLGAHYIGPTAGELIAIFTTAITHKLSLWKLRRTIYAYPTYSLIIKKAGDEFFATQIAHLKPDLLRFAKTHAPKFFALIFWGALLLWFQQYRAINDLSYQDVLLQLWNFFTTTMYGPFVYIVLYAIRPLILFPATLLTALSGALFGFWWGILYTVLGENASANFAYWIGRFFGKDLNLEDSIIGNWVEALRERPFGAVLFMRLFYVPFDLTNYGSGVLQIKWPAYTLATLIGIMPGLVTFVSLGAAVDIEELEMNGLSAAAFDPRFVALSVVVFVASLLLSRFLKRWRGAR